MRAKVHFLVSVWIIIPVLMTACGKTADPVIDFIRIEGVTWAGNVSTSFATFGSTTEEEGPLEVILPVSEGDLLYMLRDDQQLYYRYSPGHGSRLKVAFDTLQTVSAYLNERFEYMELSKPASLEAFRKLTRAELKQLSTIHIQGPISDELLQIFREHEAELEGIGLVMEGGEGSDNFRELLSICRPVLLVLDDSGILPEAKESSSLCNLKLLWVDGNISPLINVALCCGNLESLIVANWEPEPGELLPISGLKKLKTLSIAESGITSLSSIEFPPSLQSLFLVSCDTLTDIHELEKLPEIKRLGLSLCSRLEEHDPIREIPSLSWISLPPNMTQTEFMELAGHFSQLEVAELIGCTEILNLSPLQLLPELRGLMLQLDQEQLGMLASLEQLDYLILTNEVFEDNPEWIKELRESLPNSILVPGSGICLGSGWLILLIPFIFLFRYVFRKKG